LFIDTGRTDDIIRTSDSKPADLNTTTTGTEIMELNISAEINAEHFDTAVAVAHAAESAADTVERYAVPQDDTSPF
jgi:hypothetical protein